MQITRRHAQIATQDWSVTGLATATIQLLLNWQERATQRHHLATLDDRALKDVALTRADAVAEAEKPFWRN